MKYRILPRLSSMLAVWGVLLAWHINARSLDGIGSLLFCLAIAVPLAMSGAEAAFYKRHAFRSQYLTDGSWLHRLLGLALLILATEIVKALLLAALLMAATLALPPREWALLMLDVFVLSLLMPRLPGLLHDAVKRTYLFAMSRRVAIWISTLLLWLESMVMLLTSDNDGYRGLSWAEAFAYSTAPTAATGDGSLVSLLIRADAGVNGAGAWATYRLVHWQGDLPQVIVALLVLGTVIGLWFLIAWAYSRALVGAMARPLAIWRPRSRRNDDGGVFESWWT